MVYRTRQSPSQIVYLLIISQFCNERRTGSSRIVYALVEFAIGQSSHCDPSTILKSDLSSHFSGKPIHDQISDERIVQCLRIICSPKMRVTIIIFHMRSEEHTSELQSRGHLVCRLLLEKKKKKD